MDSNKKIRILIIDNNESVRIHLRILLECVPEFEIIDEAEDGQTALELTQKLLPDIVIMDSFSPFMNAFDVTKWITSVLPATKVIAFVSSNDEIKMMIDSGASGLLHKACADKEIISTVKAVSKKIELHQQKYNQDNIFYSEP